MVKLAIIACRAGNDKCIFSVFGEYTEEVYTSLDKELSFMFFNSDLT